ncbi:PREDICTED: uncharacterized protein LOC105367684 [Ceratosolen solmsi marchali]|uniref:Uncharacterized protein LOC105367684 n=1 Tax=Ceratosolen solmsi marchali TaxID=326594 RepID=A0AAJ6YUT3_9HYME|nr:PREDICTED: uncharacterized protein LOC105367684 [Ceratosolen solmsi marchali]
MFFFWSREPTAAAVAASPRAGPWFAWFATAAFLWRYRRCIARTVFGAVSSMRVLKNHRNTATSLVTPKSHYIRQCHQRNIKCRSSSVSRLYNRQNQRICHKRETNSSKGNIISVPQKPHVVGVKPRLKRLHMGDGSYITSSALRLTTRRLQLNSNCLQISHQMYYKVTRSGRTYGKYWNDEALDK